MIMFDIPDRLNIKIRQFSASSKKNCLLSCNGIHIIICFHTINIYGKLMKCIRHGIPLNDFNVYRNDPRTTLLVIMTDD